MSRQRIRNFIRNRWWVIVLATLVGAIVGGGFSAAQKDTYQAEATVYILPNQSEVIKFDPYQASLTGQQMAKSYVELVMDPALLAGVSQDLGSEYPVSRLQDALSASVAQNSVLLKIKAVDASQDSAKAIVDATVERLAALVNETSTPPGGDTPSIVASLIGESTVPDEPLGPGLASYIVAGLVFGALSGLVIAFVIETLDTRIRRPEDIEAVTTLPRLGDIPRDDELEKHTPVNFGSGFTPAVEAFRNLRTNLQYCSIDDEPKVIQVTSDHASSGKTTVAINLARALAYQGFKVCLFEADLRKPRIPEYLGIGIPVGITTVLRREAEWEDVVAEVEDRLYVLASGPVPPNPSEILGSDAMANLLSELSEYFDYVIADSAPVLPVADAAVLSRNVDGTIIVARFSQSTKDSLAKSIDALEIVGARLIGVALNMVHESTANGEFSSYYAEGSQEQQHQPAIEIEPRRDMVSVPSKTDQSILRGAGSHRVVIHDPATHPQGDQEEELR